MMNCLAYALRFWERNRDYRLFYNSNHVINIKGTLIETDSYPQYLPVEEFGHSHMEDAFGELLDSYERDLLKQYFSQPIDIDF